MTHYYSPFPVRTLETLKSVLREYLAAPRTSEPGQSRTVFGPMLITPQATTLVTVRISTRLAHSYRQINTKNGRQHIVWRGQYRVASTEFVVIELDGAKGTLQELSSHKTKALADTEMRRVHAAR